MYHVVSCCIHHTSNIVETYLPISASYFSCNLPTWTIRGIVAAMAHEPFCGAILQCHLQAPAAKPTKWEEFVAGPGFLLATGSGYHRIPPDLRYPLMENLIET